MVMEEAALDVVTGGSFGSGDGRTISERCGSCGTVAAVVIMTMAVLCE